MSMKQSKSFWEEIQERNKITVQNYIPAYNVGAGLKIVFGISDKEKRPNCPVCKNNPSIHGYYPKTLTFGTLNGSPVTFEIEHCRYQCKRCNLTFMEEFEHLPWHSGLTTDARNYITSQIGSQTFTDIAAGLGLCVQTIANIADEFCQNERLQRLDMSYRCLSMDETI